MRIGEADRHPADLASPAMSGNQLVKIDNIRWLRTEDIDALRDRMREGEFVPIPARMGKRWKPVPWADLARVIGSYNAWVRLWNTHETDRSLPLSPDWWDGQTVYSAGHVLKLWLNTGTVVEVKLRGWFHYHDGWSCCRNEAHIADVVWAKQRPAAALY